MKPSIGDTYGSLDWFAQEYGKVRDDPWGLSWRPSQALRYQRVLTTLDRIPHQVTAVMDIGCATGDFTHLLSRRMLGLDTLIGMDFVGTAIERARRRYPNIQFREGSVLDLDPCHESQFDLVTCLEVLYYLKGDQRSRALKCVKELLRAGGYAVFSSFISRSPYFSPRQFLALIGAEFEIVAWEILHLKIVNFLESVVRRSDGIASQISGGRWHDVGARTFQAVTLLYCLFNGALVPDCAQPFCLAHDRSCKNSKTKWCSPTYPRDDLCVALIRASGMRYGHWSKTPGTMC